MSAEDAFKLVARAVSQLHADLATHQTLQQALIVLKAATEAPK